MSELRFDELRGEEVVYAIHRQERTFLPSREHCPLDPTRPGGAQTEIPFPTFEIAVFDNRFPAFEAPLGAAEVVVYTDEHDGSLGTLAPERAEALMWVWRHRYAELGARADVAYVMIFENRGVEVGVTLHHPHGQIYGYPFVPPVARLERAASERLGGCAPCMLMARELDERVRVLLESEAVVAYVPYAGRWAYEAHVVMRHHRPSLLDCEPDELRELAHTLQSIVRGYDAALRATLPLRDGGAPGADRRRAGHSGRTPARRVLPAASHRREAQVPRRLRAGRGNLHLGHASRGLRGGAARCDRPCSVSAAPRSLPAART